jgi:methylmalonyl-CoA/ethylmalonyl-CoA epimerase
LIVKDVNKTMKILSKAGLGPFEPAPMKDLTDREFRGKCVQNHSDVWFTKLGTINLELVQSLEGESLQKETLARKGEGIEHLGFFVDNIWEEVDQLVQKGYRILASAKGPQNGGWAFLQAEPDAGFYIELVQPWE